MPFRYSQLPSSNHFRLFSLELGQKNDSLQGRLDIHILEQAPEYEALSYTWGAPDRDRSMRCNGVDFPITENLDGALRRLRKEYRSRVIWIDQICINQNDDYERSQQVGIMKDIYSGAQKVSAWLGPDPSNESSDVAHVIRRMAELSSKGVSLDRGMFPSNEDLERSGLPTRESPVWEAFNRMLSLKYFTRVWII
jgi:hypothetical protein